MILKSRDSEIEISRGLGRNSWSSKDRDNSHDPGTGMLNEC